MIRRIGKAFLAPFVRGYFYAKASWLIWRISTARARRLYRANPGRISPLRSRIAGDLMRDGYAVTHLDELFPGENLLPELQAYESALEAKAESKTNKLFLQQLWDVVPTLDIENPFIKRMLDRRVLDVVNDYFGSAAIYAYATLNITIPVEAGTDPQQSQAWHRDPEDRKMCKVFMYLNDVGVGSGPFMYVRGSHREGKYGNLFPQQPPRGVYPPMGAVEEKVSPSDIQVHTGRAGTVLFADTSGIHKGGYAETDQRIMFTGGFYTSGSVWPTRFVYPPDFKDRVARITDPVVRFSVLAQPDRFSRFLVRRFKKAFK